MRVKGHYNALSQAVSHLYIMLVVYLFMQSSQIEGMVVQFSCYRCQIFKILLSIENSSQGHYKTTVLSSFLELLHCSVYLKRDTLTFTQKTFVLVFSAAALLPLCE